MEKFLKRGCLGQAADDYIYFDGTGYREPGDVCVLVGVECSTWLVQFDGAGFRDVGFTTPQGEYCPSVSGAVYFDGTGFVTVDVPSYVCTG